MDRRLAFALAAVVVVALLAALALTHEEVSLTEVVRAPPPVDVADSGVDTSARVTKSPSRKRAPPAVTGLPAERSAVAASPPTGAASDATSPTLSPEADRPNFVSTIYPATEAGVALAIRSQRADIRDCFSSWLEQNPKLAGTFVLDFELSATADGSGQFTRLVVPDGGMGHAFLEGCVLNSLADLRFDAPPSPLHGQFPFAFLNETP